MGRILILTKNLLAEQELQLNLQRSNEEVYCSYDLLTDIENHQQVLSYFSIIIFSDTLSTQEFVSFHSIFNKANQVIIRKGDMSILKNSDLSYLTDIVDYWIDLKGIGIDANNQISTLTDTINESKKRMESNRKKNRSYSEVDLFFSKLSMNEKWLLYHLVKAKGDTVSRSKLCNLIWETKVNSSQLSQLSYLKKRICKKLVESNYSGKELTISWKKGYVLSKMFINELLNIPFFEN